MTDSCASIPEELLDSLDIHWVPYYIHRGEEVLRDLVTIQPGPFYRWLPTASELPKTAAPGTGDYLQVYQRLAQELRFRKIISIHMTSLGSGAYQSACAARQMAREAIPDLHIEVVDTQNVAMCHGWMVIEAARAALDARPLSEILGRVRGMIPVTQMIQTADTLRYLYLGGRIGRASHLVGSMLKIRPLIGMREGVIVALGQARSRAGAYRKMADLVEAAVGPGGRIKVAYMHAAAQEQAEQIRALIESRFAIVESLVAELSPALGVHTGPGTAGLAFYPVSSRA